MRSVDFCFSHDVVDMEVDLIDENKGVVFIVID